MSRRWLAACGPLSFVILLALTATLAQTALSTPAHAQAAPAGEAPAMDAPDPDRVLEPAPEIRVLTLENGLRVYLRQNGKPENRAELRLAVDAGSILEEDDQQGLAHFLEHMAFNGTTHFEHNDLVAYLESIGARFGPDINAYTSFDETVYMLEIPTDKEGLLDEGLQVMRDWAGGITLDPEEVEKERGVVLEEWRLGQGAQERLRRKHWPVLFHGSRYEQRLPIGKPEVIETAPPQRLRDYYTRWYRPDNMALIVVGDFDPDAIETQVRELFADLKNPDAPLDRTVYDVPPHDGTLATVATDPEMPYTSVTVLYKHDPEPDGTVGDYRRGLVTGLLTGMINARLSEITEQPDAPFLSAGTGAGSFVRGSSVFQGFAWTREGGTDEALTALMTELVRVQQHGFGEAEFERAKARLEAGIEQAYNERDKTESAPLANEYIRNFLEDEPIPGIAVEYELVNQLLPGISLEEVKQAADRLMEPTNRVIQVSAPEKDGATPPEGDALIALVAEVDGAQTEPYDDAGPVAPLLSAMPEAGTVTERTENADLGTVHLTLSNGVEVVLKHTDFKNDEVLFSGMARGGASLADPEDYQSASTATAVVAEAGFGRHTPSDLAKLLAGKIASAGPSIGDYSHGVNGRAAPADLETAFQLLYLVMTAPNPRPEAFTNLIDQYREAIRNRQQSPEAQYSDALTLINYGDHYMHQPPTEAMLDELDHRTMLDFYRRVFADASDFRFFVVGAFDPETIEDLCARYLGALPSDPGTPSEFVDRGVRFPEGVTEEVVRAGTEPKSQTQLTWPAITDNDEMTMYYLRKANDILSIRLRDVMREELGSTYGVSVQTGTPLPYDKYGATIVSYGSSPENAGPLKETVLAEIEKFRKDGPTAEEVATVTEQELRQLELGMEQNGYWLGSFNTVSLLDWDLERVLHRKERAQSLTPEIVHETFARFYPTDRRTVVTLMPKEGAPQGSDE